MVVCIINELMIQSDVWGWREGGLRLAGAAQVSVLNLKH